MDASVPPRVSQAEGGGHPSELVRHRHSLSRRQRITEAGVLQQAFDQGPAFSSRFMVLRLRRGPGAALRLGVIAGKRSLRRSVDRSRAKRMMREAYRLNRFRLAGECDVVLIARPLIRTATRQDVENDLLKLAQQAGLMDRPRRGATDVPGAAGAVA